MPWPRPTLEEIQARLIADVESRLPGLDPLLRHSMVGALTTAVAGAHHEMYGYLGWIAEQAIPDTAEAEYVERWAGMWGIERVAASPATGSITVTGSVGAVVPAGAVWQVGGTGAQYVSGARAVLDADGATISVQARAEGPDGNAPSGTAVSLVSPLSGVDSAGVTGALTGGAAAESDDALRARLIARIAAPPGGGTEDDYVQWARAAHADVTRAWAVGNATGLGTVAVYVMTDDATASGIPTAAVVTAVQEYVDARRPVTAAVTAVGPSAVPLAVTISALTPDAPAVRAAIAAEIADLIRRESAPGGTIRVSRLREAISGAHGETDHVLTAPTADVTVQAGEISVYQAPTWSQ